MRIFKLRIDRCGSPAYWYRNAVGKEMFASRRNIADNFKYCVINTDPDLLPSPVGTYYLNDADVTIVDEFDGTTVEKTVTTIVKYPNQKKRVTMWAWYDGEQLFHLRQGVEPKWPSKRVPFEDKVIEVEETTHE
jgi:hypothetical protein